jgi:4-nitrophenyl phosphatase
MLENKNKIKLSDIDLLIFDMDGVIYKGTEPIQYVAESINKYYCLNKKVVFFTNNSALTQKAYAKKLLSMNISCQLEQIFTSSMISSNALAKLYSGKSTVFVVGEEGLTEALVENGFTILNDTYSIDEIIQNTEVKCDFVIAGLDRTLTYNKIAAATLLINRGAEFYATNEDSSLPDENGFLPGAGSIISAITVASGRKPLKTFGKPSPDGILQILNYYKILSEKAIMIGDRLETDILCAKNAGINSALVLTGVTDEKDICNIPRNLFPDIIINNLSKF